MPQLHSFDAIGMRTTFLSGCLVLEIALYSGCAQTPLLEDFVESSDGDPSGASRDAAAWAKDAAASKDAGARKDAGGASQEPGDVDEPDDAEDPDDGESSGPRDAGPGKDAGASRDAAAGKDAAAPKDADTPDAGIIADAKIPLPNDPPVVDASSPVTPRDASASAPDAAARDAATPQQNQCVVEECPPCVLLATACCSVLNRCACRIGAGPCTLPAL